MFFWCFMFICNLVYSLAMLLPTIVVQIPFIGKGDDAIGTLGLILCIIECSILILSILPTEKVLKETFTEDGKRISGVKNDISD